MMFAKINKEIKNMTNFNHLVRSYIFHINCKNKYDIPIDVNTFYNILYSLCVLVYQPSCSLYLAV